MPPAPPIADASDPTAIATGSSPATDIAPTVAPRDVDGVAWAVANGRWTAAALSSRATWTALSGALQRVPPRDGLGWDLRGIEPLDHIGAQLLWNHWGQAWPARLAMDAPHKAVLDQCAQFTCSLPPEVPPTVAERLKTFAHTGTRTAIVVRDFVRLIGQFALDVGTLIRAPHRGPWRDISGQLYQFGATALPITALVGLLIGVVLAYLTSQQLRQYGAETFIVNILGLALVRELGPVLAAVLVAGRSGSAITAQIGVMRVTEELDAMRVMGIPHGFRLVMPRVLALAIAMPLISLWTSMAALFGGMIVADLSLGISPAFFLQALPRAVAMTNLWLALAKSAVFGIMIALVACHFGMRVQPNTESLGRRTTSSVVTSITVVILIDALFAVLFRGTGFR
jgi:phospholipid/cholesterol/gamma-HCH transport system permease protein